MFISTVTPSKGCALGTGPVPSPALDAVGTHVYRHFLPSHHTHLPGIYSGLHLSLEIITQNTASKITVSAYCGSCILPNLFLDIPEAGAMSKSHVLLVNPAQLAFSPASEMMAVSKVKHEGKELVSIWGPCHTKCMYL